MLKRKFRKLVNNPKLFFSDMAIKHSDKISYLKPKKMEGHYQYTVVSAVYNVGRYLDDYFNSLVKQRLDFKKHITLILVDDGSTDNSAEIIKRWQKKYPNNIQYIYKENGGQASARNLGIKHVTTEWVTFIDPDDFVNKDYFSSIDEYVIKNTSVNMISCKMVVFREDLNCFADTQPLKFCFEKGDTIKESTDLDDLLQLSASSALFRSKIVTSHSIHFNHEIKPNFEDGKFVIDYLKVAKGKVAFIGTPNYYYRSRDDGSSTTNRQWEQPEKYYNVLKFGILAMLKSYKSDNNVVPRYAQRTALYFLSQYFSRFINNENALNFLDKEQRTSFLNLVKEIFIYIDNKEILKFNLLGCWFYHKIGMNSLFKDGNGFGFQIAYVKNIDIFKNEIQIEYYSHEPLLEIFKLNGMEIIPENTKTIYHDFIGNRFCQRQIWIQYQNENQELNVDLGLKVDISIFGVSHKNNMLVKDMITAFLSHSSSQRQESSNTWIFMDSDTRADDNAEHLYNYVRQHKPHVNAYFSLRRTSKDWRRLQDAGFNLIDFDSPQFKSIYSKASVLLSSHIDRCFTEYNGKNSLINKKFIFLQHGVTKDDLSPWLNNTSRIDGVITATIDETKSFNDKASPYVIDTRGIINSGFPRHDRLINMSQMMRKMILIMPTWRKNLVGKTTANSAVREYNNAFTSSEYFTKWQEVLESDKLYDLSSRFGCEVVFMPHPNLIQYLREFNVPNYISTVDCRTVPMQEYISSCSLFITDYSSVAFDVAYLNKLSLYYQFDEDEVFSGMHTYTKGYFDYRENGFGPVVSSDDELFNKLELLLSQDENVSSKYFSRIDCTFSKRDGNCCERAYESICQLLQKDSKSPIDKIDILHESIIFSEKNSRWDIAEKKWEDIITYSPDMTMIAKAGIIRAKRNQGNIKEAKIYVENHRNDENFNNNTDVSLEVVRLAIANHEWDYAATYWEEHGVTNTDDFLKYIRALSELEWHTELNRTIKKYDHLISDDVHRDITNAWLYASMIEWEKVISTLSPKVNTYSLKTLKHYKPQLLLARAYREIGLWSNANRELSNYEKHTKNDLQCREEIALLAHAQGNWDKAIVQIKKAYTSYEDIPDSMAIILINSLHKQAEMIANSHTQSSSEQIKLVRIRSLREQGRIGQAQALFEELFINKPRSEWSNKVHNEAARLAMATHYWQDAITHWEQCTSHDSTSGMARLRCLSELGRHKAIKRTLLDASWVKKLKKSEMKFAHALYDIALGNWSAASEKLVKAIPEYEKSTFLIHKPELWLARCYREQGLFSEANKQLSNYERHTHNDPQCREQIALLAWSRNDTAKVINQLNKAYPDSYNMPKDLALIMFLALQKERKFDKASLFIKSLPDNTEEYVKLQTEKILKKADNLIETFAA
ncbi:CDP-glycerol glycerophosphotransferase family protein [Aeromonas allosaccharophila]|uniref:CDP-glycerol glycerophosphotransferase family protein n=1 Tax=Aeromonas allosaccharophila TaxID=656 RepID=A0ABZ0F6A3_9GAMM|nr:CDP-glycerol glycerophosphotransferase family protein [Aeromonas allosaccharophila]WOE64965.1 CDP-glycerol glycerophosphotransferase family protein [Aeromonas allosaccharophila]